jgi:hypothetical protein
MSKFEISSDHYDQGLCKQGAAVARIAQERFSLCEGAAPSMSGVGKADIVRRCQSRIGEAGSGTSRMSALGQKQTFGPLVANVKFSPRSRPIRSGARRFLGIGRAKYRI